jgi:flagellar assembly protein FliH
LQQAEWTTGSGAGGCIEIFEYPADPGAPPSADWDGWTGAQKPASDVAVQDSPSTRAEAKVRAEFDQRLNEETRKAFEAGCERGRQEGQQAERAAQSTAQAAAENRRTQQVRALMESFAQERDRYLQAVEHEVVELALAVAARILRRESQMDPLLLTGAVRVALGQLAGSAQVRLRVPQEELELWTEAMALLPNLALKPTVVAGEGMRVGECAIETEMGSVDLGIRAQLGEIERGFFDRAGSRRNPLQAAQSDHKADREKCA